MTCVAISWFSSTTSSLVYHQIASPRNSSSSSGSTRSGSGRKPNSASSVCSAAASCDGALRGQLERDGLLLHALEQAEVQERDAPVGEQHEVAGMRIAGELAVTVETAEEEAEDDLADAIALLLRVALELLETDSAHELADHDALARERADDLGHDDERMAREDPCERALVLSLELVVELLADPIADLARDRLDVELRRHPLEQTHDHVQVLHVGAHRGGDSGVLDLDGDLATVLAQRRPVDLSDRRGRDRLLVEALEQLRDRLFEVLFDDLAHLLEGNRRRGVAQLGQLLLELLAVLLGHEPDVHEGHDLPELHRGALHRAEDGDDLLGGLDLAAGEGLLAGLLAAGDVGGAGAELLDGLRRRQAPHGRRAAHSGCRDLLARHGSILGPGEPRTGGFYANSTREPGTMSSDPSGQRTQALWPPS
jgi:hypothetical protein